MNEPLDPEAVREERRGCARVQDAVGLYVRRPSDPVEEDEGRSRVRRANKYDIEGYATVRRDHPAVVAYIDSLEERIRQLLLDGDDVERTPTHKVSLSGSGIALADPRVFEQGETLVVTLTLYPSGRRVTSEARVVSVNDAPEVASGDSPSYRLAFSGMSDGDRDALTAHVGELIESRPIQDD